MYNFDIVNNKIKITLFLEKFNDSKEYTIVPPIGVTIISHTSIIYNKKKFILFLSCKDENNKHFILPLLNGKKGFKFLEPITFISNIDYYYISENKNTVTCILISTSDKLIKRLNLIRLKNSKWIEYQKCNISIPDISFIDKEKLKQGIIRLRRKK